MLAAMLQHVSLETRAADVEAELAFWTLLGFAPVPAPEGVRSGTEWVERGGTQIHLLVTEDPVAAPEGHAAIVAEGYEGALARLRDAGFVPERRPELWGAPRAFVRSPGGHRIEVMSAPPPRRR